jgi:hypothetical protein
MSASPPPLDPPRSRSMTRGGRLGARARPRPPRSGARHEAHVARQTRRLAHRTRDDGDVRFGTMAMSGYYLDPTAATPNRSAPSSEHWSWASPTSTPPRSTAPTPTKNSSAAPSRSAATRSWWQPNSASSRTPAKAELLPLLRELGIGFVLPRYLLFVRRGLRCWPGRCRAGVWRPYRTRLASADA